MSLTMCLLGKYFPIQGGVSKDNQWLAYALAEAGVHVHVVTNADEVESQYRCLPWSLFPALPDGCSGSITVHATSRAERRHYIPYANPFVTKLASLATEVIRTHHCDLIYAYYLEPYALAAFLASQWTSVPYGLRHAGSDVGSLFQSPELQPAYREVMRAADYLIATPATYRSFLHLSIPHERLYFPAGLCFPPNTFTPQAEPLDVNAYLAWAQDSVPPDPLYAAFRQLAQKPFHPDVPTIGIYGKVGRTKGSFDLLAALGRLQREGIAFQFLALTQGSSSVMAEFVTCIEDLGLAERTWLLPFLPHWDVPHFLRACTAIGFLERDFPLPIHTPLVPMEVFSCGTCLLLSHEVAAKQTYREQLQHGVNVFLVDPQNHEDLAVQLQTILCHPHASRRIGMQGYHEIGSKQESLAGQGWPRLITRIHADLQHRRQIMSLTEMQSYLALLYTDESFRKLFTLAPESSFESFVLTEAEKQALRDLDRRLLEYFATSLVMKQQEYLRAAYPATFALPQSLVQRLVRRFFQFFPSRPQQDMVERVLACGGFLEQALAQDEQAPPYASEIVKYERLHYQWTYQPQTEDALTAINNRLPEQMPLSLEAVPVLLASVTSETFVYPVVSLIDMLRAHQVPESVEPGQYTLVFQREARSLTIHVFEVSQETALLLDLCQGRQSVRALIDVIEQRLGETNLTADILAMLAVLQEQKMIGVRDGNN